MHSETMKLEKSNKVFRVTWNVT